MDVASQSPAFGKEPRNGSHWKLQCEGNLQSRARETSEGERRNGAKWEEREATAKKLPPNEALFPPGKPRAGYRNANHPQALTPKQAERQTWRKSAALAEPGPGHPSLEVPFTLKVEHPGPTAEVLAHLVKRHLRFMYMMIFSMSIMWSLRMQAKSA